MNKDMNTPRHLKLSTDLSGDLSGETVEPGAGGRELCGDLDMRISRDGTWYYHGSPIGRKELVRLFASVLTRDEAGDYWLITPAEMGRIAVEDAPFVAVELMVEGHGKEQVLRFRTNIDEITTLDHEHPLRIVKDPASGGPTPYTTVKKGLEARIARSVYYELVDLGLEEKIDHEYMYGVWSSGIFFLLGKPEDEQ